MPPLREDRTRPPHPERQVCANVGCDNPTDRLICDECRERVQEIIRASIDKIEEELKNDADQVPSTATTA